MPWVIIKKERMWSVLPQDLLFILAGWNELLIASFSIAQFPCRMASFWPRVYMSTAAVPIVLGSAPSLTGVSLLFPVFVCIMCVSVYTCVYT